MSQNFIDYILSAKAVRERTQTVFELVQSGQGLFEFHEEKLEDAADLVVEVIKEKYPDLNIPYHSRRGHFKAGEPARWQKFGQAFSETTGDMDPLEKARSEFDLVITSVLLDAGAGPDWKFKDSLDGKDYGRSEGLAVASFYAFLEGDFSSDETSPFRADAEGLKNFSVEKLERAFQVSDTNPLVGSEGRAQLIQTLGQSVIEQKEFFPGGRPGGLVDYLTTKHGRSIAAEDVLKAILVAMGGIWPSRLQHEGVPLGDVWNYSKIGGDGLMPFHKLSQWLTYSLIEPLEDAGIEVTNLDGLTGLPEYRNGGLFVDSGVLEIKDKELLKIKHAPGSELIVEWRALTVQLLDRIAKVVCQKIGQEMPLAKVLEGGTWWAGRKLAQELREDNSPPIKIESDGTVF